MPFFWQGYYQALAFPSFGTDVKSRAPKLQRMHASRHATPNPLRGLSFSRWQAPELLLQCTAKETWHHARGESCSIHLEQWTAARACPRSGVQQLTLTPPLLQWRDLPARMKIAREALKLPHENRVHSTARRHGPVRASSAKRDCPGCHEGLCDSVPRYVFSLLTGWTTYRSLKRYN